MPEETPSGANTSVITRTVSCPTCGGISVYAPSNPARPFCSARCKNMDFGAWASEDFRLNAQSTPDDPSFDDSQLQ